MTRAEKYYERSRAQGAFDKISPVYRSKAANLEPAARSKDILGGSASIVAKTPCGEYVLQQESGSWGPTGLSIVPVSDEKDLSGVPVMDARRMWKRCGIF